MRLFIAEFEGVYLGGYAMVVADDADEARQLLEKQMASMESMEECDPTTIQITEMDITKKWANVIWNGDY
jgi:hypothetical protein